jgi:hypothetical protein
MTAGKARYDGHSDWYDETISAWSTTRRQTSCGSTSGRAAWRSAWTWPAGRGGSGLGGRVGFHHKTLGSFLGAITGAGLNLRAVQELAGGGVVLLRNLAVAAEKA